MNQNVKKLNIDKNFREKLENLYTKNVHTKKNVKNVEKKREVEVNIKRTSQPQKNVHLDKFEEIHEIHKINTTQKKNITITIEIESYYQLLSYIFFSIFSVCLSLRVMYILFLM